MKSLFNQILICAFLIFSSEIAAQGCSNVPVPYTEFQIPVNRANPGDAVSRDGSQVVLQAVPRASPPNAGAEVVAFNPRTGATQQLTQGTMSETDFRGRIEKYPSQFYARSRDNRFILLESSATSSFPTLLLPGQTQLTQVEVIEGIPGPVAIIEVATGVKRTLGAFLNQQLGTGQIYLASLSNLTPTSVTITESVVNTLTQRASNGLDYRVVTGRLNLGSSAFNLETGLAVSPQPPSIYNRMVAKTGIPGFVPYDFQISGDGNAISFYTDRNMQDPLRGFFPNSPSGIRTVAYVYYADTDEIKPIAPINFSVVPVNVSIRSSQVFVRNIGETGKIFALDRGASYVGAPPNPTYQAAPVIARVGETPQYIVPPRTSTPARGTFSNNLAYISRNEKFIFFNHIDDLVQGNNVSHSYELFSFEISTNKLRQVSNLNDGLEQRLGLALLRQAGDAFGLSQTTFLGASDDSKVIAFYNSTILPTRTIARDANGVYVVNNTDKTNFSYNIVVCN